MSGKVSSPKQLTRILALLAAPLGFACPDVAAAVTVELVDVGELRTEATDPAVSSISTKVYANPTAFPWSGSSTADPGEARYTTTFDFSDDGFIVTYDHTRSTAARSSGQSRGWFDFRVDEPVYYTARGVYDANDPSGRSSLLGSSLYDSERRLYEYEFVREIEDQTTPHIEFGQGSVPGVPGPYSGELRPGVRYRFGYNGWLSSAQSTIPPGVIATGSGGVVLSFTPVNAPPVPATSEWGVLALTIGLLITGACVASFRGWLARPGSI